MLRGPLLSKSSNKFPTLRFKKSIHVFEGRVVQGSTEDLSWGDWGQSKYTAYIKLFYYGHREKHFAWVREPISKRLLCGWPFVSKLWHDIRAFFCHAYLRSFNFLLCGVFIPKYMTILLQSRIYAHEKSPYMCVTNKQVHMGSQKVVV